MQSYWLTSIAPVSIEIPAPVKLLYLHYTFKAIMGYPYSSMGYLYIAVKYIELFSYEWDSTEHHIAILFEKTILLLIRLWASITVHLKSDGVIFLSVGNITVLYGNSIIRQHNISNSNDSNILPVLLELAWDTVGEAGCDPFGEEVTGEDVPGGIACLASFLNAAAKLLLVDGCILGEPVGVRKDDYRWS